MILNLTEHRATQEQKEDDVVDLPEPEREKLIELLTFNTIPVPYTLRTRALAITTLALNTGAEMAMIGGAPYLMSHLERELAYAGISAMYSFCPKVETKDVRPDGTTTFTYTYKHTGFIYPD